MKHAYRTFILTEKHLLGPPLDAISKTMPESQDIQVEYTNVSHTKNFRPIITDQAGIYSYVKIPVML